MVYGRGVGTVVVLGLVVDSLPADHAWTALGARVVEYARPQLFVRVGDLAALPFHGLRLSEFDLADGW